MANQKHHPGMALDLNQPRPDPTNAKAKIKYNLLTHSRYIRDNLAPHLAHGGNTVSPTQLAMLKSIFASVSAIPMTIEYLQYSRIEKALGIIASGGGAWPADASLMAEALLLNWEESLGPLKNIRRKGSIWSVEVVDQSAPRAYRYGHLGFKVGDWWLKPAAAFRDGIIDELSFSIVADEIGAYAILMKGNQESAGISEPSPQDSLCPPHKVGSKSAAIEKWVHNIDNIERRTIRFTPKEGDPGIPKLRRECLTRNPVRVLRSAKLMSAFAPKAGLRYDGLYRVISFSVKLDTTDGKDRWIYTFQLARQTNPPQDGIETALAHPTADEMDDWKEYQKTKATENGRSLLSLRWGESLEGMKRTDDSGYFGLSSDFGKSFLRGELD